MEDPSVEAARRTVSPRRSESPFVLPTFTPDNLEIVFLSFEGPDQPYAQAGGLGVRVAQFTRALARQGFRTHLVFVGDPDRPGHEVLEDGRLHLHRWCQWISEHHRGGVYEAEIEKVHDFQDSVPGFVTFDIVAPAVAEGRWVVVMAEEWHTADALSRLSDSLHFNGLRQSCVLVWNANNDMSFHRMNWDRIGYVADFAAVSKYVKHQMWDCGVNPVVIPNGVPSERLGAVDPDAVAAFQRALDCDLWFFKIGRTDPDKGWLEAVEAVQRMRALGLNARLVIKPGAYEAFGDEVYRHMVWRGLERAEVVTDDRSVAGIATALGAAPEAAVLDLRFFVPDDILPVFYRAADGTLANSGYEPFGLVGLEAMAAGGIAYVGSTGEDYARPLQNCVVLDDASDPDEIVRFALQLKDDQALNASIRDGARRAAELFTWEAVTPLFLTRMSHLAAGQGVDVG